MKLKILSFMRKELLDRDIMHAILNMYRTDAANVGIQLTQTAKTAVHCSMIKAI